MKITASLILAAGFLTTVPAYSQIVSPYYATRSAGSAQSTAAPMRATIVGTYIAPNQAPPSRPAYGQFSSGSAPISSFVGSPYGVPTPGYLPSSSATYALSNSASSFTYGSGQRYRNTSSYFFGAGYSFPYYCEPGYQNVIYQSAYSVYDGFPEYFYAPEDANIVIGSPPTVFDPYSGQYYALNSDPFGFSSNLLPLSETDQPGVSSLPDGWGAAFAPIEQAWAGDNIGAIDSYLPLDGTGVAVGLNGQYDYSMNASDYHLMTRDAMSRLATTDFRFTDARIRPSGSATAWAIQRYRTSSGASGTVYLAYTLGRDATFAGGYRLEGVDSSLYPLTSRQQQFAARAGQNSAVSYAH